MLFWLSATRSTHWLWGMGSCADAANGQAGEQDQDDGQTGSHDTSGFRDGNDRRRWRQGTRPAAPGQNASFSFFSFGAMITRQYPALRLLSK